MRKGRNVKSFIVYRWDISKSSHIGPAMDAIEGQVGLAMDDGYLPGSLVVVGDYLIQTVFKMKQDDAPRKTVEALQRKVDELQALKKVMDENYEVQKKRIFAEKQERDDRVRKTRRGIDKLRIPAALKNRLWDQVAKSLGWPKELL